MMWRRNSAVGVPMDGEDEVRRKVLQRSGRPAGRLVEPATRAPRPPGVDGTRSGRTRQYRGVVDQDAGFHLPDRCLNSLCGSVRQVRKKEPIDHTRKDYYQLRSGNFAQRLQINSKANILSRDTVAKRHSSTATSSTRSIHELGPFDSWAGKRVLEVGCVRVPISRNSRRRRPRLGVDLTRSMPRFTLTSSPDGWRGRASPQGRGATAVP